MVWWGFRCPVRLSAAWVCAEDAATFRNFTRCPVRLCGEWFPSAKSREFLEFASRSRHQPLLEPYESLSFSQFPLALPLICALRTNVSRTACLAFCREFAFSAT